MNVKLLADYHLEFLDLKGGYTGSSESTLVKMPHFWKSHVTVHSCVSYIRVQAHSGMNLHCSEIRRTTVWM